LLLHHRAGNADSPSARRPSGIPDGALRVDSAPKDFSFHTCRHTLATWLQTHGHSEWECGLVLNHAGTGSVTAGYSHGYPLKLKMELLTKWSDHVENLVQPEGVSVLR
jgi:integrase